MKRSTQILSLTVAQARANRALRDLASFETGLNAPEYRETIEDSYRVVRKSLNFHIKRLTKQQHGNSSPT